jgi:hypothetical protein
MDVSTKISLYEYGIIRNPENDKCVFCTNLHELDVSFGDILNRAKPRIRVERISFDDVKEALEDVEHEFFEFIGFDRNFRCNCPNCVEYSLFC